VVPLKEHLLACLALIVLPLVAFGLSRAYGDLKGRYAFASLAH